MINQPVNQLVSTLHPARLERAFLRSWHAQPDTSGSTVVTIVIVDDTMMMLEPTAGRPSPRTTLTQGTT